MKGQWKQYSAEDLKRLWAADVASGKTKLDQSAWVADFIMNQKSTAPPAESKRKKVKAKTKPAQKSNAAKPGEEKAPNIQKVQKVHNSQSIHSETNADSLAAMEEDDVDKAKDAPPVHKTKSARLVEEQDAHAKALGLNPRETLFCRQYATDFNGTRSAKEAGYSEKTAASIASENLTKPKIQAFLAYLQAPRLEKLEVTADWILEQYKNMASVNLADFVTITEDGLAVTDLSTATRDQLYGLDAIKIVQLPPEYEDGPEPLKVELKLADRKGALDVLAKRLGILKEAPPPNIVNNINANTGDLARRIAFLLRKEVAKSSDNKKK